MTNVNDNGFGPRFAAVWMGLCVLAAGGGWLAGASWPAAVVAAVAMSLPAWAGLVVRPVRPGSGPRASALQVLAWTLVSLLAVTLTGGALSPLVILFMIGPLVGLAAGRGQMAIEAGVFAVIAFVLLLVLQALAGAPPPLSALAGLELAFALAGLCAVVWLVWQAGQDLAEASEARQPAGTVQSIARRMADLSMLPDTSPVLIVELTRHGRVTAIHGDRSLAPALRAGQLAEYGFGEGVEMPVAKLMREAGHRRIERPDGATLDLYVRFGETSGVLLALPAAITQDELSKLKRESQAALADRTAFFASLGHELKTPLNAIIGFSDMMNNAVRGPLQSPYDQYSGIIHESAQDLLLLVDDILDLARSETGRQVLEPESVDLVELGQGVIRQLEPQADRSDVELRMLATKPVLATADPRAIRQVWQNLVSNAIKYSEKCSVVRLDAWVDEAGAWLCVEDEGAGMDEEDLRRIASPFAQGENARGRVGTGLGLAVVKRFADLHGGKVRIDTRPGEGTRVRVTFPLSDAGDLPVRKDAAE